MKNLQTFLNQRHISYSLTPHMAKVIFFPADHPLEMLNDIKRQGGYFIQRLDGIYYPSKHGDKYINLNKYIQTIYFNFADCTIFQSQYSQTQCFAMFGERKNTSIIINGVQKKIFYPQLVDKKSDPNSLVRFVTTGNFRNIDMLEPIFQALDQIKREFDIELTIVGPVVNQKLIPYLNREYVRHIGLRTLEEVADVLRNSHIFLYSHLNPPCPNSVIEAISCGLPVVGFDSGAMSELCFFSKDLLAYVSEDIFQKYEDFDAYKLAEKILTAVQHYEHYREIALAHSHLYPFEECGTRYLDVFERYLQKRRKFIPFITYTPQRMMKKILPRVKAVLLRTLLLSPDSLFVRLLMKLDRQRFTDIIFSALQKKSSSLKPSDSLKLLFGLENKLYRLEGRESIRYGQGLHTKHKHIKYHDFFVQRIEPGSLVLDVGCGNGALTYDIATQVADVSVYGIDISEINIEHARQMYPAKNIEYVWGDALCDLPDQAFDVIVLSNVLEHIEKRVDFLQKLQATYKPKKFQIRVPIYERDWRVPLKEELGIDYRLDATHYIEYRQEEFFREMMQAGLNVTHVQINWGEIWAEVKKRMVKTS